MEMTRKDNGTILLKNVKILPGSFRNFSGRPDKFNPAGGKRYFHVVIDNDKIAQELKEEGWNVRILAPREEGDPATNYLKVMLSFSPKSNTKVVQFIGDKSITLDEDTVDILDSAFITKAKVAIRPYNWTTPTNSGISAWLKTLHVVLEDEDFADDFESNESDEDTPF